MKQTPWGRKRNGPPVDAGRGKGQTYGQQIKAEGGRDHRAGEPLGMTGNWSQVEDVKRGGGVKQGKSVTGLREEIIVASHKGREAQTSGGGWNVGGTIQVDGRSTPGKVRGEKRI